MDFIDITTQINIHMHIHIKRHVETQKMHYFVPHASLSKINSA